GVRGPPRPSPARPSCRPLARRPATRRRNAEIAIFIVFTPLLASGGLRRLDAGHAAAALDADRHLAIEGGTPDHAVLVAVIVDRVVLGRAIVPDHHVTLPPAPAHGGAGCGGAPPEA